MLAGNGLKICVGAGFEISSTLGILLYIEISTLGSGTSNSTGRCGLQLRLHCTVMHRKNETSNLSTWSYSEKK